MAERPLRLAALSVLGSPIHGRRHDLEEVVTEVLVGSDPDCHLHVDLPGISPIHARLWTDLNGAVAYDTRAPSGVYVNTDRVESEAPVQDGDMLWLGAPQQPGSVCIRCHFEPWIEVLPEAPGGPAEAVGDHDSPPDALESSEGVGEVESALPAEPEEPAATPPPAAESEPLPLAFDEAGVAEEPVYEVVEEPEAAVPPTPAPPSPLEEPPAPVPSAEPRDARPEPSAPPEPAAVEPPPAEPVASIEPEEDDPFFVGGSGASPAPPAPPAEPAPPPPAPRPGEAAAPAASGPGAGDDWFFSESGAEEAATAPPAPSPAAAEPEPARSAGEDFFITADEGPVDAIPLAEPESVEAEPLEPEPAFVSPPIAFPEPPAPPPPAPPPPIAFPEPPPPEPPAPPPPISFPEPPAPGSIGDGPVASDARAPSPPRRAAGAAPPEAPPPLEPPGPPPAPEPPRPASRPRPAGARPAPAARRPGGAARRPARRASAGPPDWLRPVGLGLAGVAVVAALGFGVMQWLGRKVELTEVSPSRVRVGQHATLAGSGFSSSPSSNAVLFGDRPAKVLQASSTRLEVEVPEAVAEAGAERRMSVVVKVGSRESAPFDVSVFQGPKLHGLSPDVAMPGEEVLLAGAGWGLGASVRFGDAPATVVETTPTQIRAVVPPLAGGSGTAAPVIVTVGGIDSNPAPFYVGHLPIVIGVEPASSGAGDVLSVSGRGFDRDPQANDVRVEARRALVVSAFPDELKVVVPRVEAGAGAALEVRVPNSTEVGRATAQIRPPADPIGFQFVAEPFPGPPDRPYAVLTTGFGPAFVLAPSGGRSAAERALEAQQRLNSAAAALASSPGLVPEARDLETSPVVGLAGRPDVLLEVSPEDAAAYGEDWTGLRGRGGAVTPARLARWWEAVARDLTLMLVRGERPRFAAGLASEGQALQQLFDAAQGAGRPGFTRALAVGMPAGVRDGLRLVALRVPAAVTAALPQQAATAPAPPPTPQATAPLQLEGTWSGSEDEAGERRYLTAQFRRSSGSLAYEGGITLTLPFLAFSQPRRDEVRFTVEFRGGLRYYSGRWDGEALRGEVTRDEAGKNVVGRFELRPR